MRVEGPAPSWRSERPKSELEHKLNKLFSFISSLPASPSCSQKAYRRRISKAIEKYKKVQSPFGVRAKYVHGTAEEPHSRGKKQILFPRTKRVLIQGFTSKQQPNTGMIKGVTSNLQVLSYCVPSPHPKDEKQTVHLSPTKAITEGL